MMLISELAQRANLPVHTIRFYEKEELIDERFFKRGENRYRYYSEAAVERVEMIKQGQAAGFTLAEIRELLQTWDSGKLTTDAQITYLEQKVEEISTKIDDLEKIKSYLSSKLSGMRISKSESQTKSV
jgi:MerR family transcriptional regulator, copper efflux regulator